MSIFGGRVDSPAPRQHTKPPKRGGNSRRAPSSKEAICAMWISRQGGIGFLLRLFQAVPRHSQPKASKRNLDLHRVLLVASRTARAWCDPYLRFLRRGLRGELQESSPMHRVGDGCCYLDSYEVAPASFLRIGNRGDRGPTMRLPGAGMLKSRRLRMTMELRRPLPEQAF
jgi:hypothetical protein